MSQMAKSIILYNGTINKKIKLFVILSNARIFQRKKVALPSKNRGVRNSGKQHKMFSNYIFILQLIKGTVKEKWKGVTDETWESQVLKDTYKTSILL